MLNNPVFQFIVNHLTVLLYGAYGVLFILIATVEYLAPRRLPTRPRLRRWVSNFSIFFIDVALLQVLSTAAVTNLAYFIWKNHWGLLNQLPLSPWVQLLLTFLLMDLQAYGLHRLYHKWSWPWRFHRVHHLDQDMDASTSLVFHPFESLVDFVVLQPFILLIGPSPLGVLMFNSLIMVVNFLTHANVRVHPVLDRVLRFFFVTPDMHRIHHSTDWGESNSNFGFTFSVWDRLLGSYRPRPKLVSEKMRIGLAEYRSLRDGGLLRMLVFPFLKKGK